MREELFYELTAVWPCNYLTYRCMTMSGTGATYVGDPGDAIAMRDAMRQGSYIIVDGVQYPVAIDDGMAELTNADNGSIPVGSFASDIVILPMTVQGNKASLFWEYFDFSGPMATPLLNVRDAYSDQPNYVDGGNTVNGGVWPQPIG
jgi:hypothetical protein